jgi:hypothetical protein
MAFDTLAYMKRLEAGGIARDEAEAHAEAVNNYLRPDLATKDDIALLRSEMAALRGELKSDIAALRSDLATFRQDVAQRESRLITINAAMLGVLFAAIALLKLI